MSFKEMALHLGEPLGTLLARHHRALAKLRGFLEGPAADGGRSVEGGS
jgi:DNA-directed RNA polymerase specialized sigma24 family protein